MTKLEEFFNRCLKFAMNLNAKVVSQYENKEERVSFLYTERESQDLIISIEVYTFRGTCEVRVQKKGCTGRTGKLFEAYGVFSTPGVYLGRATKIRATTNKSEDGDWATKIPK